MNWRVNYNNNNNMLLLLLLLRTTVTMSFTSSPSLICHNNNYKSDVIIRNSKLSTILQQSFALDDTVTITEDSTDTIKNDNDFVIINNNNRNNNHQNKKNKKFVIYSNILNTTTITSNNNNKLSAEFHTTTTTITSNNKNNNKHSALESEFHEKITNFISSSSPVVSALPDRRYRALYQGVEASANEPSVYRAFQVLFTDLLPVRVAGRMVFAHLSSLLQEQVRYRNNMVKEILLHDENTLSSLHDDNNRIELQEEVDECRSLLYDFVVAQEENVVKKEKSKDNMLPLTQLITATTEMIIQEEKEGISENNDFGIIFYDLSYELFNDLYDEHNNDNNNNQQTKNKKRKGIFQKLRRKKESNNDGDIKMLTSDKFLINYLRRQRQYQQSPSLLLQKAIQKINNNKIISSNLHHSDDIKINDTKDNNNDEKTSKKQKKQRQKKKHEERYEHMLQTFATWKDLIPPANDNSNRMMDVVRGCFIGATNPSIVEALQIVYVDYTALRVAGDLIFQLVSTIMEKKEKTRINVNSFSQY